MNGFREKLEELINQHRETVSNEELAEALRDLADELEEGEGEDEGDDGA